LESLSKVKAKQLDTEMRVLFKQFDKDRDGFVSKAELKNKISDLAVL
jgi:Ca2+-binding EF-hand superfamily protein